MSPVDLTRASRRRHNRLAYLATAAAVVVAAGAVTTVVVTRGSDKRVASSMSALIGTHWRLTSIFVGEHSPAVSGNPSLLFENSTSLTGNDGCNAISATVAITATTISINGGLASTAMGCLDAGVNHTAATVDGILAGDLTYRVQGDQLTLTRNGATLTYQPQPPSEIRTDPAALKGTWSLDGFDVQAGASASTTNVFKLTVSFDGAGHVTVTHRCYINAGDVRISKGGLDITNVRLRSAVPCPATQTQQAEQQQAAVIDDVFTGHSTWFVQRGQLSITKGTTSLGFVRFA